MHKKLLLFSTIIIMALAITACGKNQANDSEVIETADDVVSEKVAAPKDEPKEKEVAAEEGEELELVEVADNLKLGQPAENDTLTSPFKIAGEAKTANNKIFIRVKRHDDLVVIPEQQVNVKASAENEWGPFSINIQYAFSETKEGTIEIYSKDGEDETMLAQIPVTFE